MCAMADRRVVRRPLLWPVAFIEVQRSVACTLPAALVTKGQVLRLLLNPSHLRASTGMASGFSPRHPTFLTQDF
jgi:hypothetical protein